MFISGAPTINASDAWLGALTYSLQLYFDFSGYSDMAIVVWGGVHGLLVLTNQSACRTVAGVHCLDTEPFYNRRDVYFNLTHFNQRGHQVPAEWLAEQIPPPRH